MDSIGAIPALQSVFHPSLEGARMEARGADGSLAWVNRAVHGYLETAVEMGQRQKQGIIAANSATAGMYGPTGAVSNASPVWGKINTYA